MLFYHPHGVIFPDLCYFGPAEDLFPAQKSKKNYMYAWVSVCVSDYRDHIKSSWLNLAKVLKGF